MGWAVIVGSVVGFALALVVTLSLSPATRAAVPWLIVAMFGLLALGLLTYATLTVEVDARRIARVSASEFIRQIDRARGCRPLRHRPDAVLVGMGHCTGRRPGGYTMCADGLRSGSRWKPAAADDRQRRGGHD